jgi:cell pole-organizing protein PopZ
MNEPARDPSMEDILASIRKVIDEEKDLRTTAAEPVPGDDVLELEEVAEGDEAPAPEPLDLGPPLLSDETAEASRQPLAALREVAAAAPPQPQANPLEAMVREMLRPILKDWLEKHLPEIVEEHVKREIARITGASL